MIKILLKLSFAVMLLSGSAMYSQTALPGTIEVETGDISNNDTSGTPAKNVVGSGNGGSNNIISQFRKNNGVNGTIINAVTVASDGNYDFTFTYYKYSNDNTITISSTDASGAIITSLASFTLLRNDGSIPDPNALNSYGTQTVSGVALTTGITHITITNAFPAPLDLDNVIVTATPPPPTMTSTKAGDWNDPTVWAVSGTPATVPSTTPTAEYDVIINHKVTIPSSFAGAAEAKSIDCPAAGSGEIELRQNNTLTVIEDIALKKSDNGMVIYNQSGDFPTVILGGTYLSGKKTTIVKRLLDDKWTLVSSGLSNSKQFKTFDSSQNETVVGTNGDGDDVYAFGSYDDAAASGSKYTYVPNPDVDTNGLFDDTSTIWGSGIGWSTKSNDAGGSDVVFMGDLHTDNVGVLLSIGGNGFNLVGNPFPTYLYGNINANANNVLTENAGVLLEQTMWFWNSSTQAWVTKNQSDLAYHISPLQGFFVKASSAGSFSFTEAMQTHASNGDGFLRSTNNRFEIDLSITSGDLSRSTSIRYIDNTTTAFDNGYDSSMFGGYSSSLEVYTGLVENNTGQKLAIQSLPNANYEDMIIPVGVTASANSEITFTADALNVPEGYEVFLEDRTQGVFTRLDEANSEYITTVTETSTEGRFYLHTTSSALSTNSELLNSVSIYKSNTSTLRIVGLSKGKVSFKLYDLLGKQLLNSNFIARGIKEITLPNLSKGVYVVQLETENGKLNKKLVLE